jgi:hypothetical protein
MEASEVKRRLSDRAKLHENNIKSMVTPILRQQCLELYSKLPVSDGMEEQYYFPEVSGKHILVSDFKVDEDKLCLDVVNWVELMGLETLIFLGETEMPWLSQENEVKQARSAFEYFKVQGIDTRFNGGFLVDAKDLLEFVKHLFALTKLNAAFPLIYFTDKNQCLIGNLCRYGHLHIFTLTETIDNGLLGVLKQSQFKLTEDVQC